VLLEIPVTQYTSCVLEARLDIHEQISYYMLYRDTSNTRFVLCLRDLSSLVSKTQDVSCDTGISI
jgi:hypothetical protein